MQKIGQWLQKWGVAAAICVIGSWLCYSLISDVLISDNSRTGWIGWGHWGLIALLAALIFYQALSDQAAIKKFDLSFDRRYYLFKYGTFLMLIGFFFSFLEDVTGFSSDLDIIVGCIGATPAVIMVMKYLKLLPKKFCVWLDSVPKVKP